MNDDSILIEAEGLVHGSRNADYGHPLDDFSRTAKLWSAILGFHVTAEQVGLCMCAVKISRQCIERAVDLAIRLRYRLPAECSQEIKRADLVMLATERRDLLPADDTPVESAIAAALENWGGSAEEYFDDFDPIPVNLDEEACVEGEPGDENALRITIRELIRRALADPTAKLGFLCGLDA